MNLIRFVIIFGFLFFGCNTKKRNLENDNIYYFCDAENATPDRKKFITNEIKFSGGLGMTSDEAYEGDYSCKLDKELKFGMEMKIYDVVPGETVRMSVYRKSTSANSKGFLVISSPENKIYESRNKSFSGQDENGWEQIKFEIQIPKNLEEISLLKVYVYSADQENEIVYFDNLLVERVFNSTVSSKDYGTESLQIQISDFHYEELFSMRDSAFYQGVISDNFKKYVPALLTYQGETFPIDIRLKGDWTDHIIGKKWSFRIKIKKGQSLMGLKQFSIQSPKTRSFLREWIVHEMCNDEDVLTNRYNFYPVTLNGTPLGLYNLEEHFTKQLVESKKRREGPILKFDETAFWQHQLYVKQTNKTPSKPIFEASTILPFQKSKTIKSESLKGQFLIAQDLMLKYKNGDPDIESYLDVDNLAKAYAIMTIGNVKHSFIWHNQRFYYNPVLSKLELIVFDCFPDATHKNTDPIIYGNWKEGAHKVRQSEYATLGVFNNLNFKKQYLKYLKEYSDEKYIQDFFYNKQSTIDSLEQLISKDYEGYQYDKELFIQNIEKIRNQLNEYENKINENSVNFSIKKKQYHTGVDTLFKSISLCAHLENLYVDGSTKISLINYHSSPIQLVGYSTKFQPDSIIYFDKIIPMRKDYKQQKTITIASKAQKLFFRTKGDRSKKIHNVNIKSWPRPVAESKLFKLMSSPLAKKSTVYKIKDNSITFLKGKHNIFQNIIIPSGMKVVFEPGTELVFNNNTFFISYSPVNMVGTLSHPIKISSTDRTAKGFTVLRAKEKSELNYVVFDGFNTLDNYGWTLTGAVTFYESDVNIKNCEFNNNNCEDGLNVIRSYFTFKNSTMSNTAFDAIDADFCEGIISDSRFYNLGNDCLDFSGSEMLIKNCKINGAGDKGVSCGEASSLKVRNIIVDGAHTGAASKDQSHLDIKKVTINNCKIAFSSYEKKSEYGAAYMEVEDYSISETETISFTDNNSKIILKE